MGDLPYNPYKNGKSKREQYEDNAQKVAELYFQGKKPAEIVKETGMPTAVVHACISQHKLNKKLKDVQEQVIREIVEKKVPMMKNIVGLSLADVHDYLIKQRMEEKELTREDIRDRVNIAKSINDLLRLETGKSTQNIEVKQTSMSYSETKVLLEDLRKIDPVFEYPEIENVSESGPEQGSEESC